MAHVNPKVVLILLLLTLGNSPVGAETRWTSIGPPGVITALAVGPSEPRTIYAGTDGTWPGLTVKTGMHVFKSTDAGASWNDVSEGLPPAPPSDDGYQRLLGVNALVIDPRNPNTVYAAVSSVYFAGRWVHDTPPLFKTTDGGAHWSAASSGLPPDLAISGIALAIDPQNPSTLYAGLPGWLPKVFKTTDGGASWNNIVPDGLRSDIAYTYPFMFNGGMSLAVDPHNSSTIYAAVYGGGMFKSTDGGTNWSEISAGPRVPSQNTWLGTEYALAGVTVIAIDPQDSNTLYASTTNLCGCMDEPNPAGVWKSTDGGASWSAANVGLPAGPTWIHPVNSLAIHPVNSLAIHPESADTVYASLYGRSVFKSTNGGGNWNPLNDGLLVRAGENPIVKHLVVAGPNTLYAASYDGGLFKISDEIPMLSIASRYCPASSWKVNVTNATPNTSLRLWGAVMARLAKQQSGSHRCGRQLQ
jgi:photosystem II stability/assembly factor-like uncharacterized protein